MKSNIRVQVKSRESQAIRLKFEKIPQLESEVRTLNKRAEEKLNLIRRHKSQIIEIEFDLGKEVKEGDFLSYLNGLKCSTGKPTNVKLPKWMRLKK